MMINGNIIFQITVEDLQGEAIERIGRELTDDELSLARKGIEWGLGDINLIMTYDDVFNKIENERN